MSSEFDPTDFVDGDYQAQRPPQPGVPAGSAQPATAPTRAEVDSKVVEAQQKLAELKRAQEELERERAGLEETRRRQMEFQNGRQEMVHNITRGLGLLEEAEFGARRDAEQMAKALVDLREALSKIEAIHEETWTRDNFSIELTRALTTLENARMEWNSARLKLPVLSGEGPGSESKGSIVAKPAPALLETQGFGELCRLGFALTWPIAAVILLGFCGLLAVLLRH